MTEEIEKIEEIEEVKVDKIDINVPSIEPLLAPEAPEAPEVKETKITHNSIFINEKDTFDISVEYYEDGKQIIADRSSTEFDSLHKDMKKFTVTFKCPNQRDYFLIKSSGELNNASDVLNLEIVRIGVLIRSWTLDADIETKLSELHPKITQSLVLGVRDIIGFDGIM